MGVNIREKKLKDGRIALYLDIYWRGKRTYRWLNAYIGKDAKVNREARQMAEHERIQEELKLSGRALGHQTSADRRLLFAAYLRELAPQKRAASTIYHYERAARFVEQFTPTGIRLADIDGDWLASFKAWMLERMAHNSAATTYSIIAAALNRAARQGKVRDNVTKHEKALTFRKTNREFLNEAEIERFAATECSRPDVRRAFLFSCCTGLRFSDVKALTWSRIVLDPNGPAQLRFTQRKTREVTYLPLAAMAVELLGPCGAPGDRVFQLPTNKDANVVLRRWAKQVGHPRHITFHAARHSFAMMLLRAGVNLFVVKELMGHANINSTLTYLHMLAEDQHQAITRLPALDLGLPSDAAQQPNRQPTPARPDEGVTVVLHSHRAVLPEAPAPNGSSARVRTPRKATVGGIRVGTR